MKYSSIHIWLTVILIIFFSGNAFAQQSAADKLRLQISKETNDTSRVKLLIHYAWYYTTSDSEQDKYLKEAYDLSVKKNYGYGLVYSHYYKGLQLCRKGNYDEAIDKYKCCIDEFDSMHIVQHLNGFPLFDIRLMFNLSGKQAQKFQYYSGKAAYYKKHGPIENLAACYHGIAGYYSFLGDYDKSIEYYLRARDVYRSFDPFGCANEGEVVGKMYLEWGNPDKAEVYLKSALKDLINLNEVTDYFFCYHNIGDLYVMRHDYKRALQYYFEGKKYWTGHTSELVAMNLVSIAAVHLHLVSSDSARFYLDSAEKIRQKEKLGISYPQGSIEIDYNFYKYYILTGNEKCALKSLEAALQEAWSSKVIPLVLKYTKELYSYHLQRGDSSHAFHYLIQFHTVQDSLNILLKRATIATFENEQQAKQNENEIEQLKIQKTRLRNKYLIGGAFLMLVIIGFISRIRYISRTKKIMNAAKKKSEELLLNILPYETAEELKMYGSAKAKRYDEVTVMFTDFKDFTKASEQMTAEELVKIIHFYFSEFDRIISRYDIEKIKIIGDSYMCVGGLPVVNKTHACDMVSAGLELQAFMAAQKLERMNRNEPWFDLRIGIHTGPVVAGIVGTKKFAYDIWGDTVNTASFMENSGDPGKVNISGTTYERVKDCFTCNYRGKVNAKHKGEIDMYFVQDPSPTTSNSPRFSNNP